MAKVFISYRRDDARYHANEAYRALRKHVNNPKTDIFLDVDSIPKGVDFVEFLDGKVAECRVLLALIGKGWLEARDESGRRRLDDPNDFVRIEIASALRRGIPVVPVLLDGAQIPHVSALPDELKPLVRRQGEEVRQHSFESDIARLVEKLPVRLKDPVQVSSQQVYQRPIRRVETGSDWVGIVFALTTLVGAILILIAFFNLFETEKQTGNLRLEPVERPEATVSTPANDPVIGAVAATPKNAVLVRIAQLVQEETERLAKVKMDEKAVLAKVKADEEASLARVKAEEQRKQLWQKDVANSRAFATGDYSAARIGWTEACDRGNSNACANLGYIYNEGLGVAQDFEQARQLYRKACDKDAGYGCLNLGVLNENGQGGSRDYAEAKNYYKKACSLETYTGCLYLGLLHQTGRGGTQDYAEALPLFREACVAEEARGCTNLGLLYRDGKGTEQDYEEARRLFKLGCDLEDLEGCVYLGFMYSQGNGLPKDDAQARVFFQKACDGENARGCSSLANLPDAEAGASSTP